MTPLHFFKRRGNELVPLFPTNRAVLCPFVPRVGEYIMVGGGDTYRVETVLYRFFPTGDHDLKVVEIVVE